MKEKESSVSLVGACVGERREEVCLEWGGAPMTASSLWMTNRWGLKYKEGRGAVVQRGKWG